MKISVEFLLLSSWLLLLLLVSSASTLSDEGKALMSIKGSFSNVVNVLLDWDDVHNQDFCSWRGVFCDNNFSTSVTALNLSNLDLGGEISSAIGDLKSLQSLDLQGNNLTGQIPDEIGDCASLIVLDLSDNLLYGDIPFSISKLKHLELLNLKNNQLTGPIPATFTQIPNLKVLDLALNQLTGDIPRLIYWSNALQYLGLRGNSLSGTLSPDICQLTGLWFFDVRGNNLTGVIPENIGNCTSFEILDISYNQITGEIPYNVGFLQVATLSLQGNKLTGKIPDVIGLMQALAVLDLSENELIGSIPPILGNLSYTGKLYLHGNKLTGSIPPELGNMSELSYLQLNNNQLVGQIPAELGKLEQLFELNLANNFLEGSIPENISSCTALNQLNVYGNRLNGSIPKSFQNMQSLTYLNLSSNKFQGNIHKELGRVINLDTLDLSCNEFSGLLPPSVGDLEHLLTLNLSHNKLNGQLPSEFGNLKSIQIIDLSYNNLSGSIPKELGQLQNLESLILGVNELSGEIPDQLTNCLSLETLNISYNNLSGVVPTDKNFSRFVLDSFIGNPLLCGNWLGSVCNPFTSKSKALFSTTAIVCLSLGLMTLLTMVIVALYKAYPTKHLKPGPKNFAEGPPKLVVLHMDMAFHTYDDVLRSTEKFNDKYIVGYGASSAVYKCMLKNSRPIAVKRLYTQHANHLRAFETELATIGCIRHRNLVSLHGYSLSPNGNLLFYDYMVHGSLWDLLHVPSKKFKLDWETRLKIAVGAAEGLAYLHHDCNPKIIHRDVKSSNILLDENFEARLSDFGIAKSISLSKTHESTFVLGTIGYIDPEYARTSRITEKSDVYSFGIVLLELLTGKKPVDNESNLLQMILSRIDDNTLMEALDKEVYVTCLKKEHLKKVFKLALLCIRQNPFERPTMHEVARVLVSLLPQSLSDKNRSSDRLKMTDDYARFVVDKDEEKEDRKMGRKGIQDNDSCDARWVFRFGEVISNNTL